MAPGAWRVAIVASLTFLFAAALLTAKPNAEVREATARRGATDLLWRFDGNRLRSFDYATFRRATPERLRELTTISLRAQLQSDGAYAAGPIDLPAGIYDALVWFRSARPREGEVIVSASPRVTFARVQGVLANPTTARFELPVNVRRLSVRVPGTQVAGAMTEVEIVPRAVRPPSERPDISTRAIESIPGRDRAYLVYADEHAYPEGGVFWTREREETTVWIAPAGAARMVLTLSTGPMSGDVTVRVWGRTSTVEMTANVTRQMTIDLPPGEQLVPISIRSDVVFRPADVNATSSDMRQLGCQVRIGLE
jgi:hypothetical protein